MKAETFLSPRGEFVVLTGRGHVRSARRAGQHSGAIELELVDDTIDAETPGLKVMIEDATIGAWADMFAAGVASFVLANRQTTFVFRVEAIRKHGVDKSTPIKNVPGRFRFYRLVALEPAVDLAQGVVA